MHAAADANGVTVVVQPMRSNDRRDGTAAGVTAVVQPTRGIDLCGCAVAPVSRAATRVACILELLGPPAMKFLSRSGCPLCRTAVTKPTLPERCQSARNRSVKFAQAAQPARKPNSGGFLQDVFRALIDEYEASLGQRLERPRAFGGVTTLSANHLVCPHKFIARAVGHCRSSILSVTCCRAVGLAFAASYIPYLLHP